LRKYLTLRLNRKNNELTIRIFSFFIVSMVNIGELGVSLKLEN
jgi:hypothetical protein